MKKIALFSFAILFLIATSCGKHKKFNEGDAVEFMEYAINDSGDGVAKQAGDLAKDLDDVISLLPCGTTKDTTIHFMLSGTNTAHYTFERHYELVCGADTSITCSGTHDGYFESSRMRVDNTGARNWTTTGIGTTYNNYTFNGKSNGNGTWESKVGRNTTTNTSWNITSSNVIIQKGTRKITGGTGAFTLIADVVDGDSFTFSGTITFNGDDTATIVINGNSYTIEIY
ncbi:MAG: hypothetical protein V4638_12355 [Bacteroidota bacterium]